MYILNKNHVTPSSLFNSLRVMWFPFLGLPLGMYIKYPASSEKKVSQKLFLDKKLGETSRIHP